MVLLQFVVIFVVLGRWLSSDSLCRCCADDSRHYQARAGILSLFGVLFFHAEFRHRCAEPDGIPRQGIFLDWKKFASLTKLRSEKSDLYVEVRCGVTIVRRPGQKQ
jgi:hypothetical protein